MISEQLFDKKRKEINEEWKLFSDNFPFAIESIKIEFVINKIVTLQIALEQIIEHLEKQDKQYDNN